MRALQDFIRSTNKLPTPPAIALKILKAVRQDNKNFDELAEIVMADPVLTGQILKIANSSMYGLPKQVTSLSQATGLLGTQTLTNIALSFVIVDGFKNVPEKEFDLDRFWRRAISTAVAAQLIAKEVNYPDNDIFISGLLQDIGVLVLFLSDATAFSEILDNKRVNNITFDVAERERFGFDHTDLGGYLLESWNLPESIVAPIRFHNIPERGGDYMEPAFLLHVADKISSIYHGSNGNRNSISVHKLLSQTYKMKNEQIDELIDNIGSKSREVMDFFSIDPGETKPFSLIIQEANDELQRLNFTYEQVVFELKQAKTKAEQMALALKRANDKLRELAFRDELTGLFNHRYFQETFAAEIGRSTRYQHSLSLFLLDIDHFKQVNDTYGHLAGDQVLREVSQTMQKLVRSCDIVARYGGEEFAIVLPETGTAGAKVLAQRIRRGIEQLTVQFGEQKISVTVSIGVSSTDMEEVKLSQVALIERTDKKLYQAKQTGRNKVVL